MFAGHSRQQRAESTPRGSEGFNKRKGGGLEKRNLGKCEKDEKPPVKGRKELTHPQTPFQIQDLSLETGDGIN